MLGTIFNVCKINTFSQFFSRFCFVFVKMGPCGRTNLKRLLLEITGESFQTSAELSSQWSSQNCVLCYFLNLWSSLDLVDYKASSEPSSVLSIKTLMCASLQLLRTSVIKQRTKVSVPLVPISKSMKKLHRRLAKLDTKPVGI